MVASVEARIKRPSRAAHIGIRVSDFAAVHEASQTAQGALDVIRIIRAGVPATDVSHLAQLMGTTKEHLIKTLDLPRATVDRKAKAHQNLSSEQSERVVGMAKLVGQVQAMIERSGDPTDFNAAQWLEQPSQALGGQRPAELMDTVAGQEVVSDLVAKMQSGAYA